MLNFLDHRYFVELKALLFVLQYQTLFISIHSMHLSDGHLLEADTPIEDPNLLPPYAIWCLHAPQVFLTQYPYLYRIFIMQFPKCYWKIVLFTTGVANVLITNPLWVVNSSLKMQGIARSNVREAAVCEKPERKYKGLIGMKL